jgi:hypothetical protein
VLEDGDRLGASRDRHIAERLVRDVAPGETPRLLADEHLSGTALLLESSRDVQRVADEVGIAVGDHHLTGVDADPERERLSVASLDSGREFFESLLDRRTCLDRAAGVVLGHLGDAEDRHHPVAHELGDGAGVRVDHVLEQRVVSGEHEARDLRVSALTEPGGTSEIGEQHRDRLADCAR